MVVIEIVLMIVAVAVGLAALGALTWLIVALIRAVFRTARALEQIVELLGQQAARQAQLSPLRPGPPAMTGPPIYGARGTGR